MEDKKKLLDLIIQNLQHCSSDCEICQEMRWKCPVYIPKDATLDFQPDMSVCSFRQNIIKTLTIENI